MTSVSITKCDWCNQQIPDDSTTAVRLSSVTYVILIRVGTRIGDRVKYEALDFCGQTCLCFFLDNIRSK